MTRPGNLIRKDPLTPTQTSASGIWTLDQAQAAVKNNTWPVSNGVSRSLRFNSADSAFLTRTPATAGNRRTWTWSGWVKRSKLGSSYFEALFAVDPSPRQYIAFYQDKLYTYGPSIVEASTVALFRDVSAWYHVVGVWDTTQATGSDRMKFYVNGIQQTLSFTTTPTLNLDGAINTTQAHTLGGENSTYPQFNGYMTDVYFIDGQALTPSDFAFTDPATNQWRPKRYSGSYGVNGFYLDFSDNTSTTNLGLDRSGNANHWTASGFSVTTDSDSVVDTPTNYNFDFGAGGEVRGNYCTLSPLTLANGTLSNGNLDWAPSGNNSSIWSTMAVNTGKWYFEIRRNSGDMAFFLSPTPRFNAYQPGEDSASVGAYMYYTAGTFNRFRYNGADYPFPSSFGDDDAGTVYSIFLDFDTSTLKVRRNNDAGSEASFSMPAALTAAPLFIGYSVTTTWPAGSFSYNFGQRPFAYAAPEGFKCLCSTNLPEPTIRNSAEYFNTVLYTGNGSTQSITGVGFQPDFVWYKRRNSSYDHRLFDSVRGATKALYSNLSINEFTESGLTSFNSDGFSLGTAGNETSNTYVAWNWRASSASVVNTAGSITSTARVNQTSGFSIVTYTGTGANATVGHGLGVAPSMIIIKNRTAASGYNWNVYHSSIGNTQRLYLDSASEAVAGVWNNTSPTSTVFTIAGQAVYNNNDNFVAYCFAAISEYSAFGSYTGNGSTDGTFVYTGFRPAWVIVKNADNAYGGGAPWYMWDNRRPGYNWQGGELFTSGSGAEDTAFQRFDILSNGFKLRSSGGAINGNGEKIVYAAFAEAPFKYSRAR